MSNKHVLDQQYKKADKMMLFITWGLFVYALALASWHNTWLEAFLLGGGTAGVVTWMHAISSGSTICRITVASGLMVMTALHIHQAQGMIEMHFGVFALLAMLLYYRDWMPIAVAAAVIAVHHAVFYALQVGGAQVWVLSSDHMGAWVIMLHAAYVVAEAALLIWFAISLKGEALQSAELLKTTEAIVKDSEMDLTQRTSGSSELLQRFDRYTASVEDLAKEVQQSSDQLGGSGSQLSAITSEIQQASNAHQQETSIIATAIEQMSAAIKEVSENASLAFDASNQVDKNASEAMAVSEQTRSAVDKLSNQVSEGAATIEALNEQSNNIGSVLAVIRGIADQTNLLALNAAIEAARAGEQGRGFAVVADEVRTLAQRTQESTEEIDAMIEALQSGSKNAVSVIKQSRQQAIGCVENTARSVELMREVSREIDRINGMNSMIASSSNEQTSVVDEISQSIANILTNIEISAEDASKAADTAKMLDTISIELNEVARRFKVSA